MFYARKGLCMDKSLVSKKHHQMASNVVALFSLCQKISYELRKMRYLIINPEHSIITVVDLESKYFPEIEKEHGNENRLSIRWNGMSNALHENRK